VKQETLEVSDADPVVAVGCAHPHHHHTRPSRSSLKSERSRKNRTFADDEWETKMGLGRGMLLWLLGVPLPIVILLALFWR
jgi:hypothetical protein